jgi:hypothetical protein
MTMSESCPATANLKGEHIPCDKSEDHDIHSNRQHGLIWTGVFEAISLSRMHAAHLDVQTRAELETAEAKLAALERPGGPSHPGGEREELAEMRYDSEEEIKNHFVIEDGTGAIYFRCTTEAEARHYAAWLDEHGYAPMSVWIDRDDGEGLVKLDG